MSHLKDFEWRAGPDHLKGDHTQRQKRRTAPPGEGAGAEPGGGICRPQSQSLEGKFSDVQREYYPRENHEIFAERLPHGGGVVDGHRDLRQDAERRPPPHRLEKGGRESQEIPGVGQTALRRSSARVLSVSRRGINLVGDCFGMRGAIMQRRSEKYSDPAARKKQKNQNK